MKLSIEQRAALHTSLIISGVIAFMLFIFFFTKTAIILAGIAVIVFLAWFLYSNILYDMKVAERQKRDEW